MGQQGGRLARGRDGGRGQEARLQVDSAGVAAGHGNRSRDLVNRF